MQQRAVDAETLGLVKKSGPSRTTNLFLVGLGVLAIGGAIGFIVYVLNTQDCETNGDCESGVCDKNNCVECVKNSDCNPGFECKENACKKKETAPPQCTQDSDCTAEQPSCKDGKCSCTDASCKAKGDNFVCDAGGGCIDTTAKECTGNSDCARFKKCDGNKCVTDAPVLGVVIALSVLIVGAGIVAAVVFARRQGFSLPSVRRGNNKGQVSVGDLPFSAPDDAPSFSRPSLERQISFAGVGPLTKEEIAAERKRGTGPFGIPGWMVGSLIWFIVFAGISVGVGFANLTAGAITAGVLFVLWLGISFLIYRSWDRRVVLDAGRRKLAQAEAYDTAGRGMEASGAGGEGNLSRLREESTTRPRESSFSKSIRASSLPIDVF